jgi:response regulator RpfG family c-di-GMP phosphodiesterase
MTDATASKSSILIVDDDENILLMFRDTLDREGHGDVITSSDPVAAVGLLRQRQFSVILTDQLMPRMSGLEFLAQAKTLQPDATRVLLTGVVNLSTVIDAINEGEIYRFIVKPWLREELLVTIKNAVQRFDLLRHNRELHTETQAANQQLAAQIAKVAEQNSELENLNAALHRNLDQSVQLCVKTLDAYWPVLSNQAQRVQELCRAMASTLKLPADQRRVLDIAALLHDIGLIEVPRDLIRKWREYPEGLSDTELRQIQHHPVLGQELVGFVDNLAEVGKTIRAHHERYDGAGYPDRLHGENIPWLARLLTVAVAYATSVHEGAAPDFIKANSGAAFDPDAVRAFVRSLPHATLPRRQREVLFTELRPGMVLAQGIYSPSGLLLVSEGQALNGPYIDKLRSHNHLNPIDQSLIVYG